MKTLLILIVFVSSFHFLFGDYFCKDRHTDDQLVKFHPLRHCQRSNKSIVAVEYFRTVKECAKFARENKALAFNFSPTKRGMINKFEKKNKTITHYNKNKSPSGKDIIEQSEEYYNCQILQCPELRNFSTLINDTRFDYYSAYVNPPPPENASCLPGVGMFIYYEKPENYSRAFNACREINSSLADILSDLRTSSLSQLMQSKFNSTHKEMAFVDLKEKEHNKTTLKSTFCTSYEYPLECYAYRAWSPGFPRRFKNTACVTITTTNSWKVVPCSLKQPFICELFPTGPNRTVSLAKKCSITRNNNP
ncbi:uncharacterized protein DMENIID0001_137440 [Sergentomyia squamirostris]